jgi:hypothetical protein
MKVRLFNLVAIAAITLSAQGVAQQNDSLERALADLNSGLTAPMGNAGYTISGDFRARNRWYKNDAITNNRDIDTRARLNFLFNVTENSQAFVGFNADESWGDAGTGTTPGQYDDAYSVAGADRDFQLLRSWVAVDSLLGEGGRAKIGRDYYTPVSGRILGTEEWDNVPASQSGIWYDYAMDSIAIHFSMLNGLENGYFAPSATTSLGDGDDMVYVFTLDWTCDYVEQLGPISVVPYWIRNEVSLADADHDTWLGVLLSGEAMGVGYEVEYSDYEHGEMDGSAWYARAVIGIEALAELPGVEDGGLSIAMSDSDDGFATTGVTKYHNAVGFSDKLGAGGIWTADTSSWNVGLDISPAEGWNGNISVMNVESGAAEWNEIDLSVGHTLGGNVEAWFGYAMVDNSGSSDNEDTFWAVLDLGFGN